MAEYKYVRELLDTGKGTEGQLLIPRMIHDVLIDEVSKALIPRSEAAFYIGPASIPGSSYDIDLVVENKLDVRVIAEGAEIFLDQTEYTSTNVKPLKYGVGIRITKELMEDSKWNLLAHNLKVAGKRFAENENTLVIAQFDTTSLTTAGSGAITIADITASMQQLEDKDYQPTTFFVGVEILKDLRNIDTFTEADKVGNREMLETGFIGRIFGMNVMKVSTNAGMTSAYAYIIDNTEAYCIVEKRPITVENFGLPAFDMQAASVTQRIAVKVLRGNAISKITT